MYSYKIILIDYNNKKRSKSISRWYYKKYTGLGYMYIDSSSREQIYKINVEKHTPRELLFNLNIKHNNSYGLIVFISEIVLYVFKYMTNIKAIDIIYSMENEREIQPIALRRFTRSFSPNRPEKDYNIHKKLLSCFHSLQEEDYYNIYTEPRFIVRFKSEQRLPLFSDIKCPEYINSKKNNYSEIEEDNYYIELT